MPFEWDEDRISVRSACCAKVTDDYDGTIEYYCVTIDVNDALREVPIVSVSK